MATWEERAAIRAERWKTEAEERQRRKRSKITAKAAKERAKERTKERAREARRPKTITYQEPKQAKILKPRVHIVRTFSIERDDDGSVIALRDEQNIFATREQILSVIDGLKRLQDGISDAEIDRCRAWDIVQQEAKQSERKQQDGQGFVYIMKLSHYYKIGISRDPSMRLSHIQCSFPLPILLVREILVSHMRRVETFLHNRFAGCWAAGEWFRLSPDDLQWIATNEDELAVM